MRVGIAIITHNARHHLKQCLPPLLQSSVQPRVLLMNSSSEDGTVALAKEMGVDTHVFPRNEFNHGATREKARRLLGTDIVVMMTPDAYAQEDTISKLIAPLVEEKASIAYARQVSHHPDDIFETFPRSFNYSEESHVRGFEERDKYGVYTIFNSDSCAAYRNALLDEIGGFERVLLGEDTLAAHSALSRGHKIAYVSEAVVKHSHRYSLGEEFRRHFDTGLVRREWRDWLIAYGRDGERGKAYVCKFLDEVYRKQPRNLPYALLHLLAKWSGYQLGRALWRFPRGVKQVFSSQDYYWN